jgi:hypothetical protein
LFLSYFCPFRQFWMLCHVKNSSIVVMDARSGT